MNNPSHRVWMYRRIDKQTGELRDDFIRGVEEFDRFARSQQDFVVNNVYRCPCTKCKNMKYLTPDVVRLHLYRKGFVQNYWFWTSHGEVQPTHFGEGTSVDTEVHWNIQQNNVDNVDVVGYNYQQMETMLGDAFRCDNETPVPGRNVQAETFYKMLESSQQPLFEGCSTHSELSAAMRLLSIKSEHNMSNRCFNDVVHLMQETTPMPNRIPSDFNAVKKKVKELGLDYKSIHCCRNGCMLYWKEDCALDACKFCGAERFKNHSTGRQRTPFAKMHYMPLIPRLQRLYASKKSAEHMTWHKNHVQQEGCVTHPSDAEAWKHFDRSHPSFADEARNVRLGLCADGFNPYSNAARPYSVWPIVICVYNLPPHMCMTRPYMFLSTVIPGPHNPTSKIDVYLQPLMDELTLLWSEGVHTYDVHKNETFKMKAALMWTVNDFPAYGMLSGWSTHGALSCPVCQDQLRATYLQYGRKMSWFDCHRCFLPRSHVFRRNRSAFMKGRTVHSQPPQRLPPEMEWEKVRHFPKVVDDPGVQIEGFSQNVHNWTKKSIFWDLPYWKNQLLRHNLDVMHIEKNFCENIVNTVFDVPGKSKDTSNARLDVEELCAREELHLRTRENGNTYKPKAKFALSTQQKKALCEWLRGLGLPDGYCSNFNNKVDPSMMKLQNMKSHDYHVFMETLLPIALSALPDDVLEPLVALGEFFKNLCANVIREDLLMDMHSKIPLILCKLETIFPPAFWNVMEHLPVHLAQEAYLGGPVHYRWMYPFERFFHWLKQKAKNKSQPESSMVMAYLIYEIKTFGSHYFDPKLPAMMATMPRNVVQQGIRRPTTFDVFGMKGSAFGRGRQRHLTIEEYNALHLHVLLNCKEVHPYMQ